MIVLQNTTMIVLLSKALIVACLCQAAAPNSITKRRVSTSTSEAAVLPTTPQRYLVETAIFVDSYAWRTALDRYGNDDIVAETNLRRLTSAIVGHAQVLFRLPSMRFSIDIKVVHFQIWKQQPKQLDPVSIGYANGSAIIEKVLQEFSNMDQQTSGNWDVAILATGIPRKLSWDSKSNEYLEVNGLAHMSGACNATRRTAIVGLLTTHTFGHEVGHLLGIGHDAETEISRPARPQPFKWSVRSLLDMYDTLRRGQAACLLRDNHPGLPAALEASAVPADGFSVDELCNLAFKGTSAVTPNQTVLDPSQWCQEVACLRPDGAEEGSLRQLLYGTPCGAQNYCFAHKADAITAEAVCGNAEGEFNALSKYNFAFGFCTRVGAIGKATWLGYCKEEACARLCDLNDKCRSFTFVRGNCELRSDDCVIGLHYSEAGVSKYKDNQVFVKKFDWAGIDYLTYLD